MFKVLKTDGAARRGEFSCPHGTVQTPVFMNVGTQAAIKGALSAADLETIGTQVELSNTYHLHLRPGDEVVRDMGGLHKFMTWDGPILTDSGGFQVFSLAGLRKIKEEGVTFASHLDGHKIFMGPEESMRIQSNLGSDIAMAFDECVENPATYPYAKASCERTARWLARCKEALTRYNAEPGAVNPGQQLWGINQGATFKDLRIWHMKEIAKLDLPGYAIGGSRRRSCTRSSRPSSPTCRRTGRATSWASARRRISSSLSPGAWTSSTASCPRATRGTRSCLPGRGVST